MNVEEIREYCIIKPAVTEGFPFNDTALVFKVMGKMFALLDLSEEQRGISLKCDPEYAIELRERYSEIQGAWHFNKKMWNSVDINGSISRSKVFELVDHSYEQVVLSLKKKDREALQNGEF